ncbi:DUF3459 domain-containing protein [Methylobacterium sp. ID0610]|uniref:DUF3459 domain-containing protein n=1 Tax=Methylobacterium carpenticola TaxID=3344827 RepID=UPI0036C49F7A
MLPGLDCARGRDRPHQVPLRLPLPATDQFISAAVSQPENLHRPWTTNRGRTNARKTCAGCGPVCGVRVNPRSLLSLYRELLKLRRREPALASGTISAVAARGNILTYERELSDQAFAIVLNFGGAVESAALRRRGHILLSSLGRTDRIDRAQPLCVGPHETIVFKYS